MFVVFNFGGGGGEGGSRGFIIKYLGYEGGGIDLIYFMNKEKGRDIKEKESFVYKFALMCEIFVSPVKN